MLKYIAPYFYGFLLLAAAICVVALPRGTVTGARIRHFLLAIAGMTLGAGIGVLLNNLVLGAALGGVGLLAPIWYTKITERIGQRSEDEQLEITLSVITSSYVQTQDFLAAVQNNLSRIPTPFHNILERFLRELKTTDPSIKSGLYAIRAQYDHPRWREWIDAVIQCQDDRSLVYILPPIVAELSDARRMSAEVATTIAAAWRDYVIIACITLGQIPLLKILNGEWYALLTETFGGQIVMVLVFTAIIVSAFAVWKINKPISF